MPLPPLHPKCLPLKKLKDFRLLLTVVKASESLVIANGCQGCSSTNFKNIVSLIQSFFCILCLPLPSLISHHHGDFLYEPIITIAPHLIFFFPTRFFSSLYPPAGWEWSKLWPHDICTWFRCSVEEFEWLLPLLMLFLRSQCCEQPCLYVTFVITPHYFGCQINAWSVYTNRLGILFFLGQTVLRFRMLWRFSFLNSSYVIVKTPKVEGMWKTSTGEWAAMWHWLVWGWRQEQQDRCTPGGKSMSKAAVSS